MQLCGAARGNETGEQRHCREQQADRDERRRVRRGRVDENGHEDAARPESGEQGLERVQEKPFDLILLDVMLPGKDGFAVCRELRRSGFRAPIILLTARSHEAEKVMGLELGADEYVLLDRVWGQTTYVTERVVDTHIGNLRKKIERDPERPAFVTSVRGFGYRFEA